MLFNFVSFIHFLSLYALRCIATCPASKKTITYVSSCPKTHSEWKWRAEAKKCWLVKQECIQPNKFVYHCVINSYANSTLEVCAPAVHVIGHSCAEFNMLGGLIQDSPYKKCKTSCPFSYDSTEVYKYKMCFNVTNVNEDRKFSHCICPSNVRKVYNFSLIRSIEQKNCKCKEVIWQIVSSLLLLAIVALTSYVIWIIVHYTRNCKKEALRSEEDVAESQPLQNTKETKILGEKNKKQGKRYIVSIEISESYFGWAVQDYNDPKSVNVMEKSHKCPTRKHPTSILVEDGGKEFFGYGALSKFISSNTSENKDRLFFHQMKQVSSWKKDSTLEDADIYSKILDHIVKTVTEKAKYADGKYAVQPEKIEYVIAIPGHWKNLEQEKTFQEAIEKSMGIQGAAKYIIVTKAEVVSPFLHEVKADVVCQNFNVDHLSFGNNTKYAILDIGTTACELTFLTSKKEGKDTADENHREQWGEYCVEDEFLNFLNQIFGLDVLKGLKQNTTDLLRLLLSIEKIKTSKDKFGLGTEPVEIKIPSSIKSLIEKTPGKSPQGEIQNFNEEKGKGETVSWKEDGNEFFLCISHSRVMDLYKNMLKTIERVIKLHFDNDKNSDIKCVCIIGGYANTKLVQKKVREVFPEKTVVLPKKADLVVAQGAVYYGYKYN